MGVVGEARMREDELPATLGTKVARSVAASSSKMKAKQHRPNPAKVPKASKAPTAPKAPKAPKAIKALKAPKAASRIATLLRREIVTGALLAGDKLLPERVLQEQFQVSRPTLREAMRLLESESLIKISRGQHGGARVQRLDTSVTARQLGMYLQMEGTTLSDVLQARSFLEPPAAGLIAENHSSAVIKELRSSVEAAKQAYEDGNPRKFAETHAHFSEILTEHAGNQTLALLARLFHDIVRRQMTDVTVRTHSQEGVRKMQWLSIRGREKLIELIEKGQAAEAEQFWRQHLQGTARVVLSSYRAQMPIDVLQDEHTDASPSD
jgi:DNA-binding FadR family transcriptional regulator